MDTEDHASSSIGSLSAARAFAVATALVAVGTAGFIFIDGMIVEDAGGSRLVNAFYCSVITLTT